MVEGLHPVLPANLRLEIIAAIDKQAIVDCAADDMVYTSFFTGVKGDYLKPSIRAQGLDPDNLPANTLSKLCSVTSSNNRKSL